MRPISAFGTPRVLVNDLVPAILQVMCSGHLGGAVIDVYEHEPYTGELTQIDRCLLACRLAHCRPLERRGLSRGNMQLRRVQVDSARSAHLTRTVTGSRAAYHFAALADLNEAPNKPLETARVNVLGTVNVLEACRVNAVQRFVHAGTVYVYSREGGFYRCSKQAAEHNVEEYRRAYQAAAGNRRDAARRSAQSR